MRIRCERCKAEYEVDESQIGGGHLEVQCSVCSHVFMVGQQSGPRSSPTPEERVWFVQTADGRVHQVASLAALGRSIQAGQFTPQDRLTHDHQSWQALGDRAEFVAMFASTRIGPGAERLGSEPQETYAANATTRFVLEPKSHGLLKVSVGLAVAAGVAFAGIRWQQDRDLHFRSRPVHAAAPAPIPPAAHSPAIGMAHANQAEPGPKPAAATSRPLVQALPAPPPPVAKKEPPPTASPSSQAANAAENYDRLVTDGDRSLENGSINRARDLYQRALNLRPAGFKAMTGLGFVALDRGQLSAAYDYFKRALTAKTSYPPALFGIAEVHRARGEKGLALHSYQRYLDMSPDGADAPAARRHVQKLQANR